MSADYIKNLREEIAEMKKFIEPLESGRESIGERKAGEQWRDVTREWSSANGEQSQI
jgi:hypothetical protein